MAKLRGWWWRSLPVAVRDEDTNTGGRSYAVDGLNAGVEEAVGFSMLGWAQAGGFPAAEWERDIRAGGGCIDLEDARGCFL